MRIKVNSVRNARENRRWSQEELAIAADVSVRTIQRTEASSSASLQTLKSISAALEIELESLLINQPETVEYSGMTQRKMAIVVVAAFFVVVTVTGGVWAYINRASSDVVYQVDENWEDLPVAEKVLGHWESVFNGAKRTIDLDGTRINAGGGIGGNAHYTIRGDTISYGFNGQILTLKIEFISPKEMLWRSLDNNAIFARYHRDPTNLPSTEEVQNKLLGSWQEVEGEGYLLVNNSDLTLQFFNEPVIESYYLLSENQLMINSDAGRQVFVANFFDDGSMTLHVPNTNKQMLMSKANQ